MIKVFAVLCAALLTSCAGTSYITPDTVTKYDSKFSDTDLKMMSSYMAESLKNSDVIRSGEKKVLGILHIKNKTSEHINSDGIADKLMVNLLKTGKVKFANRENLKELIEEQRLSAMGVVDESKAKEIGKLFGIDYFLSGFIESIEKKTSRSELTYYRLSLKLTDVETGEIVWADETELKKKSSKHIMDW
ncbi:MAG: penicillin-binding protein activator LpoB [Elusimicrobia bacterium]|nr:penicillin-binding protein activator LpoB [Elusimicrobiota bacterium]